MKAKVIINNDTYISTLYIAKILKKNHKDLLKTVRLLFDKSLFRDKILINKYSTKNNYRTYIMYYLHIDIAIQLVDNYRNFTYNKAKLLNKFYKIKGNIVLIQGHERRELEFIRELKDALKVFNIKLLKQYKVDKYRIDGYIPKLNIAIEFDEYHHSQRKDKQRQKFIENKLKCNFIRVHHSKSLGDGIAVIIKAIIERSKNEKR